MALLGAGQEKKRIKSMHGGVETLFLIYPLHFPILALLLNSLRPEMALLTPISRGPNPPQPARSSSGILSHHSLHKTIYKTKTNKQKNTPQN